MCLLMIHKNKKLPLKEMILIIILFLIAFIIRIWHLTDRSLWNDELWTVFFSSAKHLKNMWSMLYVVSHKFAENPPLYLIVIRFWVNIFGNGEFAFRFPSVIFGSLSIPVFYFITKQFVSKKIALICSILLIFSPIHIYYSQEARCYSLFILLSFISTYFFVKLMNSSKGKIADKLGYISSITAMLYTHYYSIFLILAHILLILLQSKKKKNWIFLYSLIVLLFTPWMTAFLLQLSGLSTGSWVQRIVFQKGLIDNLFFFSPYNNSFPISYFFIFLFFLGIIKTFFTITFTKPYLKYLLLLWFSISILVPLALSQIFQPFFVYRFTFISLAPYIIYVSIGLEWLTKYKIILFISIILIIYLSISNMANIPFVPVENWKAVLSDLVQDNNKSGIPLLVNPETPATEMAVEYYSRGKQLNLIKNKQLNVPNTTCFKKILVISRYANYNPTSICRYTISKRSSSNGLLLFKLSLIK